jgi:hypothetical protein
LVTVAISSWRVSRLNIVAIRDLPTPPSPDAGLRPLFTQPARHLFDAFRQLFRLRPDRTLKRLLWDGPRSSVAFFIALIGRGHGHIDRVLSLPSAAARPTCSRSRWSRSS